MKKIFVIVLAVVVIAILKWFYLPSPYKSYEWYEPAGRGIYFGKYDFLKYSSPIEYDVITYRNDPKHRDHRLVYLANGVNGQELLLASLHWFPTIEFDKVEVTNKIPDKGLAHAENYYTKNTLFSIWHYVPLGYRDDFENAPEELIVKGINEKARRVYETDTARILEIEGEFQMIELKKESDSWRKFVSIVFDFKVPMRGKFLIINNKDTGKSYFAIGANTVKRAFDDKEFQNIIESIKFKPRSYHDSQMKFRAYRESMQEIHKGPELDKVLQAWLREY